MYKEILAYLSRDIYPFHMPGHKRNPAYLPPDLAQLDMTEIPGMDVLAAPEGLIKKLQEEIAGFYGADQSYFLVNGSSAGIVAAICAACTENTALVAPRNAHVSMYNGLALSGARPVYVLPAYTHDNLAGGLPPEALDIMPRGAAVFAVSPTYEGFVSDIAAIAREVHSRDGVLIVDEAHGAHFAFDKRFPPTALSQGADIAINSFHKTLPALTQCAVLHVKGNRIDLPRLRYYINAVQTSSPSYVFIASCDFMLRKLWECPRHFDEYLARLDDIRNTLPNANQNAALVLSGKERVGTAAIHGYDPGKLLFSYAGKIKSIGNCELPIEKCIAAAMVDDYKIQMEYANERHVLAMTSVADTDEGFKRLKAAICGVNEKYSESISHPFSDATNSTPTLPEIVLTPREALSRETELVSREKATGRIAGELITAYPPGIALATPGEKIPEGIKIETGSVRVVLRK